MPKIPDNLTYLRVDESGTPDNPLVYWGPITLQGGLDIRGDHVWVVDVEVPEGTYGANIRGSHCKVIELKASGLWRAVQIWGGNYNRIEACDLSDSGDGVYVKEGGNYNTIIRNKITNCGIGESGDRAGIAFGETGVQTGNRAIENTLVYCGTQGGDANIVAFDAPESVIEGNVIKHSRVGGVQCSNKSHHSIVRGNIVNDSVGYGIEIRSKSHSTIVEDNTLLQTDGLRLYGVHGEDMTNIQLLKNQVYGSHGSGYSIDGEANFEGLVLK